MGELRDDLEQAPDAGFALLSLCTGRWVEKDGTKALLVCGILSSLLYVAMNVFVPMQCEGYSSASQTVSELSAIGAPTRPLWVLLGVAYTLLVTAFGWGVWRSARRNRPLRVVGGLMVAYGVIGLAWPFAPMHLRGGGVHADRYHAHRLLRW